MPALPPPPPTPPRVALRLGMWMVVAMTGSLLPAQTVTLSGSVIGSTPSVLGYNSGHFLPGSNVASWWKHAGVNGSRIFSSPSYMTPGSSTYFRSESTLSLSATSQTQFVAQRDALRSSGTATTFIRWDRIVPLYTTGTTDGNNSIQLKTAEDAMTARGIKPLIVMTRSPGSYTWPVSPAANAAADWQDRWLAWQQWYAQAFVHAQYNDVQNYQFFNEPDLYANTNGTLTQDQWLEMVQVGANAVECAVADVNRLYGKSLVPHVYGPVTTGPDTAAGGWGDLLIRNRHAQFITGTSSSYRLFDHYDYHNYGSSPSAFGTKVADTVAALNTATGGNASQYPVVLSEFNTRTSSNYDPTDTVNNPNGYTPDTLDMSSRLGQILVNLANNKADELYLFKFTTAGGAFNGVHWQSETGTKNVGGATRSAAAYQLFTEGFTGNTLLKAPSSSDSALTMAAAADTAEGKRFAYIANGSGSAGKSMTLDLSTWNVAAGSTVTVKQVSGMHQGDIGQTITVPANRTITVNADPFGVVLVTAPTVSGLERRSLTVAENAYVQEGSLSTNFSGSAALLVRSGSTTATHNAAYLKFTTGTLSPDLLADATLSITAFDPGATGTTTAGVVCHVYGISNNSWRQTASGTAPGISWSIAPNISQTSHPTSRTTISQNYVSGVGTTADIVGQFAATGTATTLSIDVGRWVAERVAAGDTSVSFMITRDVRFDGDLDHDNWLSITSREGAGASLTLAPTLTLATRTAPITISLASGTQTQLQTGNSVIRGTSPVTKTGAGMVIFDAANNTTGTTTIQAGTLRVSHPSGLTASPTVIQGGRLLVDTGVTLKTPSLALTGGTLAAPVLVVNGTTGIGTLTVDGGQISGAPAAAISGGGRMLLSSNAVQEVTLSSLTIAHSTGGRLDLGMGRIGVVAGGMTAADLQGDLAAGFAGGSWSGTSGIVSSAVSRAQALGLSRTIGWTDAGDGTLLVAYAAAGDTNLDGLVDLLDAANVLSAGLYDSSTSAVWSQGDFNYDAAVDILDVADLLSTGLYDQGPYGGTGTLREAGVAAVPEPAVAGGIGILSALGALARIRSRR